MIIFIGSIEKALETQITPPGPRSDQPIENLNHPDRNV
jgi:hypothetical protein